MASHLNQDELSFSLILPVKFDHGVSSSSAACKAVNHDPRMPDSRDMYRIFRRIQGLWEVERGMDESRAGLFQPTLAGFRRATLAHPTKERILIDLIKKIANISSKLCFIDKPLFDPILSSLESILIRDPQRKKHVC